MSIIDNCGQGVSLTRNIRAGIAAFDHGSGRPEELALNEDVIQSSTGVDAAQGTQ